LDSLILDLRYAIRTLLKSPGFTLVAVLTLALGIGANTAIFSVVSAVLLRPLPYPDAGRIALVWGTRGDQRQTLMSVPAFHDWAGRTHTFEEMGIARMQSVNLTGSEAPDRLSGNYVTASTLHILGARAQIGRLFTPQETAEGTGQPVALVSYATWRARFGGDPHLVGRSLILNGRPHVVIGVTDSSFTDTFGPMDVWLPITSAPNPAWLTRAAPNVWGIGRLKSGVTLQAAQLDLSDVAARLATEYPATDGGSGAAIVPLRDAIVGPVRPALLLLLAFVGVVLLIACANVANLQLARATSRAHEMSMRAALGAGRSRLARQLLTESLVLSVVGGGLGLLMARWEVAGLVAIAPAGLSQYGAVGLDTRVLLFVGGIMLGTGLLFGAAPALHASRADIADALRMRASGGSGGGALGARNTFVGVQLVLSIVLLVGAGLLTRSLAALQGVEPGFDADRLLTAEFRLPSVKYGTPERISSFMSQAVTAIRAVPGVRAAALIRSVPLSGNWASTPYVPDTRPELTAATAPVAQANVATDGFFGTMGIPLLAGRDFDAGDRSGAPTAVIVNAELARQVWPGQSAVGRRLKILGPPDVWATVVGVAGNVKQLTLREPPGGQIYGPVAQQPGIFASVVARTAGDPMALVGAVRAAIWSVDPDQPVWKFRSMASLVSSDVAMPRFTMALTGAFALLALLLAAVGVYGVMSYAVAQRTREVGIRMALGARGGQVVGMVLRRGLRVIGIATLLGLGASLVTSRLLRDQLFGVSAMDPLTWVAAVLVLSGVGVLACWVPARRAAKVDPVVALKCE
jgi:putative ABC transport system permease protein